MYDDADGDGGGGGGGGGGGLLNAPYIMDTVDVTTAVTRRPEAT
jgi:hypothetical protein